MVVGRCWSSCCTARPSVRSPPSPPPCWELLQGSLGKAGHTPPAAFCHSCSGLCSPGLLTNTILYIFYFSETKSSSLLGFLSSFLSLLLSFQGDFSSERRPTLLPMHYSEPGSPGCPSPPRPLQHLPPRCAPRPVWQGLLTHVCHHEILLPLSPASYWFWASHTAPTASCLLFTSPVFPSLSATLQSSEETSGRPFQVHFSPASPLPPSSPSLLSFLQNLRALFLPVGIGLPWDLAQTLGVTLVDLVDRVTARPHKCPLRTHRHPRARGLWVVRSGRGLMKWKAFPFMVSKVNIPQI